MKNGTLLTVLAVATAAGIGYMLYKQHKKKGCNCGGCQDKTTPAPIATTTGTPVVSQPVSTSAATLAMDGFPK